jgi:hypothetical protein
MHVFLLIISLAGGPEHIAAVCETYKGCSDQGAATQQQFVTQFHKLPKDFSYRIVPGRITQDATT